MDHEAQTYFRAVEQHFVERRGRPLLLSPDDVRRVARWHETGIPLPAVREGIDIHFDRLSRRGRAPRRAVTLAYCEDDVLDAWSGARRRRLGARPTSAGTVAEAPAEAGTLAGPGEHARLVAALHDAAARLRARGEGADADLAGAVLEAAAKLDRKAELFDPAREEHDEQRAEDHLRRLERSLLKRLEQVLGAERVQALADEVAEAAADKRDALGEAGWERVRAQLVARRVREHCQLPRLSIFYL